MARRNEYRTKALHREFTRFAHAVVRSGHAESNGVGRLEAWLTDEGDTHIELAADGLTTATVVDGHDVDTIVAALFDVLDEFIAAYQRR